MGGFRTLARPMRHAALWNRRTHRGAVFTLGEWCKPIAAGSVADANSGLMMDTTNALALGRDMTADGNFKLAYENFGFSVTVWYADASIPPKKVFSTYGYDGSSVGGLFPLSPVRIPTGAHVPSGSDGHMAVIDYVTGYVYSFWRAIDNGDGTWNSGHLTRDRMSGYGYNPSGQVNGPRAYGGSVLGGLIRYQELVEGRIPHPLAFSYETPKNHQYAQGLGVDGATVNISSSCDADGANADTAYNIPEGARIRLKASVNIATRAAGATHPATATTIGTALRDYGAYLVDRGGHPTLYAEDLTNKGVSWTGILVDTDTAVFGPTDFEVLSLPAVLGTRP